MERTGHRSNSVRSYKRTSNAQLSNVSEILYGKEVEVQSSKPLSSPKKQVESCSDENNGVVMKRPRRDPDDDKKITVNVTVNVQ